MSEVSADTRGGLTRWVVLPIAVVLGLLVLLLATRDTGADQADRGIEGRAAPAVVGTATDGSTFDLDDERGRWVVVNFFSTTCQPCIVEHPELIEFHQAHAAVGDATVVSIAFDDSASNVEEFFADNGGDWPVLVTDTGGFALDYGVTGVPESYLVSPSGLVWERIIGGVTREYLDASIEQAMAVDAARRAETEGS